MSLFLSCKPASHQLTAALVSRQPASPTSEAWQCSFVSCPTDDDVRPAPRRYPTAKSGLSYELVETCPGDRATVSCRTKWRRSRNLLALYSEGMFQPADEGFRLVAWLCA